jgi:serine O-acetyltransferase
MRLTSFLLRLYQYPVIGHMARQVVYLLGADIPRTVHIGSDFALKHRGLGVVIHPATHIGDRVAIFQGVTIGQAAVNETATFAGVRIESRSVIGAGAKVLAPAEGLTVGRGTVIAANAVLTESTGEWETWGGIPARRLGERVMPATADAR